MLYKLNYLDIFYNNNQEVILTQNNCPEDVQLQKLNNEYVYVSPSGAIITEECCRMWGGLWKKGFCVSTKNNNLPGGGLPNPNPDRKQFVPVNQTTSGAFLQERPYSLLKNRNVVNSDTVIVKGQNNFVGEGSSNSIIMGNNSSLLSGVKNALVIGDNVSQAKDNSITVGDLQISEDGTIINLKTIIDGGFNTVMYEGKTNYIDILDGTFNSVRNLGGDSKLRPIISGSNTDID